MRYSGYELLWMFAVYSVAGWCLEVCAAAAKQKKFVNRGYLNGPFCPVYGLTSAAFGIVLPELKEHLIFLFLGGMIIAAFAEYICGFLLERISGQKWWDYSGHRFSARGYICLPASLFWGIVAVVWLKMLYPILSGWIEKLPVKWGKLLSNSLILFMVFDMALSGLALGRYSARQDEKTAVSQTVSGEEGGLNGWLDRHFPDERMKRIYPNAKFVD